MDTGSYEAQSPTGLTSPGGPTGIVGNVEQEIDLSTLPFDEVEGDETETETLDDEETEEVDESDQDELKESEKTQSVGLLATLGIVADDVRAKFLTQKTPRSAIYQRPARGGGTWRYVKGDYIKRVLNSVFAFQWDFELVPVSNSEMFQMTSRQVIVVGKLTIRDKDGTPRIVKMGIGKKDIAYRTEKDPTNPKIKKPTNMPLDVGNDIKAAETDALKRCATALGIGLDLYREEATEEEVEDGTDA